MRTGRKEAGCDADGGYNKVVVVAGSEEGTGGDAAVACDARTLAKRPVMTERYLPIEHYRLVMSAWCGV